MVRGFIFDMDGLLIDSEIGSYKMYLDVFSKYGFELTLEDYGKKYCGRKLHDCLKEIINQYHYPISFDDALKEFMNADLRAQTEGIPLKKGAKELIEYLFDNGYKIALATSSIPDRAYRIIRYHHLEKYFSAFAFGLDVSKGKPAPDIFLLATERLGVKPENCIVLEDAENGIDAAFAANTKPICVPDIKYPDQKHIDKTILVADSLLDVLEFIKKGEL